MSDQASRELPPPEEALTAPAENTVELLRMWMVDGMSTNMIRPAMPTPQAFGLLLAEVVRNAGEIYAKKDGTDPLQTIGAVIEGLTHGLEQKAPRPRINQL